MSYGRTFQERLVDWLLFLYLTDQTNELGWFGGKIRAQKIVFLSETDLQRKSIKGLNYGFIRHQYGPYSGDLDRDITWLHNDGFLAYEGGKYFLMKSSEEIMELSQDFLKRNATLLRPIDKNIQRYARISTKKLLDSVYRRKAFYHPNKTIKKCELRTVLLKRLSPEKAKYIFQITKSELATFDLLFDRKATESLEKAQKSAQEKPSQPWVELPTSS